MKHLATIVTIVTIITLSLLVTTSGYAGMADTMRQLVLRQRITSGGTAVMEESSGDLQIAYIPYCIEEGPFATGINITIDSRVLIKMVIGFFDKRGMYYSRPVIIGLEGWTGLVSSLLPPDVPFVSGSAIAILSVNAGNGKFWVTQVLFSPMGFSHVVRDSERLK